MLAGPAFAQGLLRLADGVDVISRVTRMGIDYFSTPQYLRWTSMAFFRAANFKGFSPSIF